MDDRMSSKDEPQQKLPCPLSFEYLGEKSFKQFGHFVSYSQSQEEAFSQTPGVCYSLCYNYLSALHETTCNVDQGPANIVNNAFWGNGNQFGSNRGKELKGIVGQDQVVEIYRGQKKTLERISRVDQVGQRQLLSELADVSLDFGFQTDKNVKNLGAYNNISSYNPKSITTGENLDVEIEKLMQSGSAIIFLTRNFDADSGHAMCMGFKREGDFSKFTFFDPNAGEVSFIFSNNQEKMQTAKESFKAFLTDYFKYLSQPQLFHATKETPNAQYSEQHEGFVVEKPGYVQVRVLSTNYNAELAKQIKLEAQVSQPTQQTTSNTSNSQPEHKSSFGY